MTVPERLQAENTALVVIDIQDRLVRAMPNKEALLDAVSRLVRGAVVLEVPVILTEQYPQGLGETLPEVKELMTGVTPVEKTCFSCADEDNFQQALKAAGRRQVLVCGIEAHICVYQTAMALLREGYQVQVVVDCVDSRQALNKEVCLTRMSAAGIGLTTVEMALFELLKVGRGDRFKQISNIVK